jgi:acetyl-CoA synthetase (ADP-forming)
MKNRLDFTAAPFALADITVDVFKYTIRQEMTSAEFDQVLGSEHASGVLDEPSAKRIFAAAGIAAPRSRTIGSARELPIALEHLAFPLVAKLVSRDATHKSDVGGVKVNLATAGQAASALAEIETAAMERGLRIDGFLLEEMVSGQELVLGGIMDNRFGPVLMLGLGGIFVEVLRDVVFRICPLDRLDAFEMIGDLRGAPLLRGARGRPPISEEALVQAILAIGGQGGLLPSMQHRIIELDINPLIATGEHVFACDARIVLRDE